MFEFSDDLLRLPIYRLLVSLSRQDCRRVWLLLVCLELGTKSVEPSGFVIHALLLGTTLHITMGHSTLDSTTPDKFLEIPSYMLLFGEKDWSEDFALLVLWTSV